MSLKKDIKECRGNTKGLIFILLFRMSSFCARTIFRRIIGFPIRLFYKVVFEFIYGIEIRDVTMLGEGFNIYHGYGTVKSKIGNYVTIRHNTTIGDSGFNSKGCPIIGNHVQIGVGSILLGPIKIGDNVLIAAGSVVIKDVPSNCLVGGNPAKVLKYF